MKKVLFVAYHYPPSAAVGAVRPAKLVRYLPEFGWEPTVLTRAAGHDSQPNSAKSEAEVYRVREWPHPLKAYERFMLRRARQKGVEDELIAKITVPHAQAMAPSRKGIRGLKRWFLVFFWVPDRETGWLVPAIWLGRRLIRKKRITHIVTTGPPFTCHLVGLALQYLMGVKWIADFRDPWTLTRKIPVLRNSFTDFAESKLIRSVARHADIVLSVTPQLTEEAQKEHSSVDPAKFVTLTNGFDPSDFSGLCRTKRDPDTTIFSYIGTFYTGQSPEMFLRALLGLLDDGHVKPEQVRVWFYGNVAFADGLFVPDLVRDLRLDDIVTVGSYLPREDALRLSAETHIALVFTEHYAFSSKLYNALACGSIILNIGSTGEVAELLAKTGRGVSVNHKSLTEIRNGILECIRRRGSAENLPEPWRDASIQEFNFQHLTGRLAALLEGLA